MFEYVQNFVHEEKMLISHLNWVVVLVNLNAKSANCHDELMMVAMIIMITIIRIHMMMIMFTI